MASSTRTSFRPRPLDNNKQLEIVRDENADLQSAGPIDQADIEATRRITNGHETLDAHNEKVGTKFFGQPAVDVAVCSCQITRSTLRHIPRIYETHIRSLFPAIGTDAAALGACHAAVTALRVW